MAAETRRWALALALLLGAKLVLLAVLGPTLFPDSGLYIHLGQDILSGPDWLHDGQWSSGWSPERLSRPYGYPLLVAAASLLAGQGFPVVLAVLQAVVSVAVLGWFAHLARPLIGDRRLWGAVVGLCALSQFVLFDLAILTDSLYASLFIVTLLTVAGQIGGVLPCRADVAVGLGLAWAASLTLRDVGLYHTVLPMAGLVVAARMQRRPVWLAPALFVLPVAALVAGILAWNQFRTGHAVFSITGGVNWLWPSVNIADRGLGQPFDGSDAISMAARRFGIGRGMGGVLDLADRLSSEGHLDAQGLGQLTFQHFLGVVRRHPGPYLLSVLGNLQFAKLADLVFNPLANLNELFQMHDAIARRLLPGLREMTGTLRAGDLGILPALLVTVVCNAAAVLCLAFTTLYAPWRLVRDCRQGSAEAAAILFVWLAAAAFIGSYSLVHMEMRHALPAVPLLLLAFGWAAGRWRTRKETP